MNGRSDFGQPRSCGPIYQPPPPPSPTFVRDGFPTLMVDVRDNYQLVPTSSVCASCCLDPQRPIRHPRKRGRYYCPDPRATPNVAFARQSSNHNITMMTVFSNAMAHNCSRNVTSPRNTVLYQAYVWCVLLFITVQYCCTRIYVATFLTSVFA